MEAGEGSEYTALGKKVGHTLEKKEKEEGNTHTFLR